MLGQTRQLAGGRVAVKHATSDATGQLGLGRLQVLGWRWQTVAGIQDWLVHLGAQPLPVRLPTSGVTARYLAADGCWQPTARTSRRTAWPWPPATVLVVEHAAA